VALKLLEKSGQNSYAPVLVPKADLHPRRMRPRSTPLAEIPAVAFLKLWRKNLL
jgi:hypothetical protein